MDVAQRFLLKVSWSGGISDLAHRHGTALSVQGRRTWHACNHQPVGPPCKHHQSAQSHDYNGNCCSAHIAACLHTNHSCATEQHWHLRCSAAMRRPGPHERLLCRCCCTPAPTIRPASKGFSLGVGGTSALQKQLSTSSLHRTCDPPSTDFAGTSLRPALALPQLPSIALQVLLRANPQLQDDLPEWRGALDRIMGHSAPATQLLLTWLPQQVYGTARIPHRHSGLRAVLARRKV